MSAGRLPPLVLLVVEDSDEDFETAEEALSKSGLPAEIRRSRTGGEGLALLRAEAAVRPSLVLMDLNTPGIDGRAALLEIKADPTLQAIPVVVFSTSAAPRDLRACYEAGANAYHVKPVRYPDHLGVLTHLFRYWLQDVVLPDRAGRA